MKLSRNVNNKKRASKMIFFNVKVFRKIRSIFDVDLNVRILQFLTTFTQLTERLKMGWLLVLGLKESLVECATVCVKSEVILILQYCSTNRMKSDGLHFSFQIQ